MGKRRRLQGKRSQPAYSKITLLAKLIPCIQEFHTSKESFVQELKDIFARHLKDFNELVETRIESRACVLVKHVLPARESSEQRGCYIHDPSNEYFHIFTIQLNKFMNSVLTTTREVLLFHPKLFSLTLSDSYRVIELLGKEVKKITACFYSSSEINFEEISLDLYREKLENDSVLSGKLRGEVETGEVETDSSGSLKPGSVNGADENSGKKAVKRSKKRKKREKMEAANDLALDLEVEDFSNKLAMSTAPFTREKPRFSEDWINGLRKRLKERS
jgi:hypothetical protein